MNYAAFSGDAPSPRVTSPELRITTLEMVYAHTGPNVPVPYGRTSVVPSTVTVTVGVEHLPGGEISLRATTVKVTGCRAKADGTAGKLHATAEFWLSLDPGRIPTEIFDIVGKATAQVRLWIENQGVL